MVDHEGAAVPDGGLATPDAGQRQQQSTNQSHTDHRHSPFLYHPCSRWEATLSYSCVWEVLKMRRWAYEAKTSALVFTLQMRQQETGLTPEITTFRGLHDPVRGAPAIAIQLIIHQHPLT